MVGVSIHPSHEIRRFENLSSIFDHFFSDKTKNSIFYTRLRTVGFVKELNRLSNNFTRNGFELVSVYCFTILINGFDSTDFETIKDFIRTLIVVNLGNTDLIKHLDRNVELTCFWIFDSGVVEPMAHKMSQPETFITTCVCI